MVFWEGEGAVKISTQAQKSNEITSYRPRRLRWRRVVVASHPRHLVETSRHDQAATLPSSRDPKTTLPSVRRTTPIALVRCNS